MYKTFFLLLTIYGHTELNDHLRVLTDKTAVCAIPFVDYLYVINLDHRPEKYQQTLEQFAPYGITPYRFSAVNGWKLPLEVIWDISFVFKRGMRPGAMGCVYGREKNGAEYQSNEIIAVENEHYLNHLSQRGMVGCILSHLTVIQDALRSGYEVVWICEDDIEVVRDPTLLSKYIHDLDTLVGRDHWDLLFTFRGYRTAPGNYLTPYGAHHRPDIDTRNQESFNIDRPISSELKQVGSRFGTQSMIWTRRGMEKVVAYYQKYKIFTAYDLDLVLIPDIQMYSVQEDVVTNSLNTLTDLSTTVAEQEDFK